MSSEAGQALVGQDGRIVHRGDHEAEVRRDGDGAIADGVIPPSLPFQSAAGA